MKEVLDIILKITEEIDSVSESGDLKKIIRKSS
jgi:hypothetical protein